MERQISGVTRTTPCLLCQLKVFVRGRYLNYREHPARLPGKDQAYVNGYGGIKSNWLDLNLQISVPDCRVC